MDLRNYFAPDVSRRNKAADENVKTSRVANDIFSGQSFTLEHIVRVLELISRRSIEQVKID